MFPEEPPVRYRANVAHMRQVRPNSGLGLSLKPSKVFPRRSEADLSALAEGDVFQAIAHLCQYQDVRTIRLPAV